MIILALSLLSLFPLETPQEERQKQLAPFFSPKPDEGIAISRSAMLANHATPLKAQGHVWVNPPNGRCFIVRKTKDRRDINVCSRKKIKFSIGDLNSSGVLRLLVIQGKKDPGTYLFWQTPHRFANFSPLGDFQSGRNQTIPIFSCKAEGAGSDRKITLERFDGRIWYVTFPANDTYIKKKPEDPNLFVKVMTATSEGQVLTKGYDGREVSNTPPAEKKKKKRYSQLAEKLSGRYKIKKKKSYPFITSPYETFVMNSANFFESGGPRGMNGQCRYRFSGAPGDYDAGVIECFNTDLYDAVFAHLPCAAELPVQPEDAATTKQK